MLVDLVEQEQAMQVASVVQAMQVVRQAQAKQVA